MTPGIIPVRPSLESNEILDKLTDIYFEKVFEWMKVEDKHNYTQQDKDDVKDEIRYVFDRSSNDDGDVIVEDFKQLGWSTDRTLIDIMDSVLFDKISVHKDIVKKWVSDYDIKPKYSIGDIVSYYSFPNNNPIIGEITEIYDDARYLICSESLCHVKTGTGTNGCIIEFERVSKV